MINVKGTIFSTLTKTFDKMRLLAQNNSEVFKKIMFLIVLDDLYDWSDYLDDSQSVQKRLLELRTNFILCNKDFDICRFPFHQYYVNVNTPQTNDTWKRVWDSEDLSLIEEELSPYTPEDLHARPFTPDSTCPISIIYFGEGELIPADSSGAPHVDFDNLTICDKMNIYINRTTGQIFFLDPDTCTWKPLKGELVTDVTWKSIVDRPNITGGINHVITDEDQLKVSLLQAEQDENGNWIYGDQESNIQVTDSNPDPELNDDLKYIL